MEKIKIETIEEAIYSNHFSVHRFDMDSNEHVNNLRYLQWAMESIPDEIVDNYFLSTIDGNFVGEAQYGQTIESLTDPAEEEKTFNHTLRNQENKQVFSTAKTVWKNRN